MFTRPRSRLLVLALTVLVGAAAAAFPTAALGSKAPAEGTPDLETLEKPERREVIRPAAPRPSLGERAARIALRAVGIPYRYAGESPASGFDCSGLVRWAYKRVGIDLPHSSYALHDEGHFVRRARMKPGDVLFFEGLGHVGMYLGRGRMVHAPQSGRVVEVVSLIRSHYGGRLVDARRVAPG